MSAYAKYVKERPNVVMLRPLLLGVGMVLHLERDAWLLRQSAPPPFLLLSLIHI